MRNRVDPVIYGPFANYLQIACHKAKIKEEMHAGHRIRIFLMFSDEIRIIFMVLIHLRYVHGHEILNCTLIYSTVICHKRILRQNHCSYSLFINILPRANVPSLSTIENLYFCMYIIWNYSPISPLHSIHFFIAFSLKFDSHDSNAYKS